jgi:hypothetical protein
MGAHHQNGVAERAIQTVTWWARAMLLHSILMWPDQADLSLWPFALNHTLQDSNKLPKWQPRSRRGKFLGLATTHSTSIGLILLNLRTGFVSPQYHVVYDDEFTTMPNSESGGLFDPNRPFNADHGIVLLLQAPNALWFPMRILFRLCIMIGAHRPLHQWHPVFL